MVTLKIHCHHAMFYIIQELTLNEFKLTKTIFLNDKKSTKYHIIYNSADWC